MENISARVQAVVLSVLLVIGMVGMLAAQSKDQGTYVGADKCKACHSSSKKGDQYGKWKSEAHSKAHETLAKDEAKKLAAEKGISNPQEAGECMMCHATAWGVPKERLDKKFDLKMGVQCESCHGPGETHFKARMAAMSKGEISQDTPAQIPEGEIVGSPPAETCKECHNDKNPTFKGFDFEEAKKKIAHPDPRK